MFDEIFDAAPDRNWFENRKDIFLRQIIWRDVPVQTSASTTQKEPKNILTRALSTATRGSLCFLGHLTRINIRIFVAKGETLHADYLWICLSFDK